MYIKVLENSYRFPYSVLELKAENKNVSFPSDVTSESLALFNVFEVVENEKPTFNSEKEFLEMSEPFFRDNVWMVDWVIKQIKKTPEQVKKEITDATSQRLDSFAQTRNYDSILSACTYATSSVVQFAKEGQYCVNMRDATWAKLYDIIQEVEAGTRSMPTRYADIEAELPVLDWANLV